MKNIADLVACIIFFLLHIFFLYFYILSILCCFFFFLLTHFLCFFGVSNSSSECSTICLQQFTSPAYCITVYSCRWSLKAHHQFHRSHCLQITLKLHQQKKVQKVQKHQKVEQIPADHHSQKVLNRMTKIRGIFV